jgi:hypothetical protein
MINHQNNYRYIFEPFRKLSVPEMTIFIGNPICIFPENNDSRYIERMRNILSGKFNQNDWVNKFNNKKVADRRIIKAIRAHFFLKWIRNKFPDLPIIYLMRHPIPSSLSKDNLHDGRQWIWRSASALLKHDQLRERHLEPFEGLIRTAKTPFEEYVLLWCIQNYVVLKEMDENDYKIVYYEDFCLEPEKAVRDMMNYIGGTTDLNKLKNAVGITYVTHQDSAILRGEDLIRSWTEKVTNDQIVKAMHYVHSFGLEEYYNESPYPLKSKIIDQGANSK